MAIRKLIAVAFALACPLSAAAFEGEQRDLGLIAQSIHGASIAVDYDVKWKLSTLMGEPTRNLKIRWRLPRTAAIRLPNDPAYEGAPSNFLVRNLPPDVQDSIRLYDVNVPIGFTGHEAGYDCSSLYAINVVAQGYVTFDAGAPAKPGDKWSYNVTGSPNWAQLMADFQGRPLSEGTAKSVMSTPNLCGDVQDSQVTGKVALGEALRWIHKNFDKRSITEMIAGSQRQLEILSDTLGLPVEGPISEFDRLATVLKRARTAAEIADIRQQVEAASRKLRDGIPARYVPADKAQDYQAERDDVSSQTEQILVELIPDESTYDVAAAAYQQWIDERPTVALYNVEEAQEDMLWIVTMDGERVRKVVNGEYVDLLASRYLYRKFSCLDEKVDLLDPASLDVVHTLTFNCPGSDYQVALFGWFPDDLEKPRPVTADYLETLIGYTLRMQYRQFTRSVKGSSGSAKYYDVYTTSIQFDRDLEEVSKKSEVTEAKEYFRTSTFHLTVSD